VRPWVALLFAVTELPVAAGGIVFALDALLETVATELGYWALHIRTRLTGVGLQVAGFVPVAVKNVHALRVACAFHANARTRVAELTFRRGAIGITFALYALVETFAAERADRT
jgi:hypothetical protein